ncbi:hypothetical protein RE428_42910 [Marinobacter nanhaiticus D15-8W]|nr:hypothetical protein RE428_42910 [Marinobacter nanhaiticus D15-8W]
MELPALGVDLPGATGLPYSKRIDGKRGQRQVQALPIQLLDMVCLQEIVPGLSCPEACGQDDGDQYEDKPEPNATPCHGAPCANFKAYRAVSLTA